MTDDHVLICFQGETAKRKRQRMMWRVFNLRDGTLVQQLDSNLEDTIGEHDIEIACMDFSNLDDP